MKKITLLISFIFLCYYAICQITPLKLNCLGGSLNEYVNCIYPFGNNEFVFAGSSTSNNGDLTANNGNYDCWFVHFDTTLNILNTVSFGEDQYENIKDVHILSDTSFLFLIQSNSASGIFSGGHGGYDMWLRSYYLPNWLSPALPFGGTQDDMATSFIPKTSGGYLVCGNSRSSDGDLSGNFGLTDFWVLNLSPTNTVVWSKNFGGSSYDEALKIFQLTDGSILVFGNTTSDDDMVHESKGVKDIWVVKLNSLGDTLWTKTLGGTGYDELVNVKQTGTDQFAIIGNSNSVNGDFYYVKNDQNKIIKTYGFYHVIDGNGQFVFGGNKLLQDNDVFFNDLTFTSQQDVQIFGHLDTDTNMSVTNDDILMLNFNNGIVVKTDTFGGNAADGYSYLLAQQLSATEFLVLASTNSTDLTNTYHNEKDVLLAILSTDNTLGTGSIKIPQINIFPNPAKSTINIENLPHENNWIYSIYTISGKIVQTSELVQNKGIDIKGLSNGIYIFSVTDGSMAFAKRIVIGK